MNTRSSTQSLVQRSWLPAHRRMLASSSGQLDDVTLYSYWRSTCSWRVRIALAHHGVHYTTQPVHLLRGGGEQLAPSYSNSVNKMAQVPALSFRDMSGNLRCITQSLAIIDFLDSVFADIRGVDGSAPLIPRFRVRDADAVTASLRRARALEIAEVINSGTQPLQNLPILRSVKVALDIDGATEVDGRGFGTAAIKRGLDACEQLVASARAQAEPGTLFAVGDSVTIADVCIIPQLFNGRRFNVDLSKYPHLLAVEAACAELPSFQAAHPERQPDAE